MLGAIAAIAAGCSRPATTVAVVLPETGNAGVYGQALRRGVELALEDLEPLGRAFDVVFFDSASQPAVARQALEGAFRRGAVAAIGGVTSAEALAMTPVADRAQRVLLSPTASSPQLSGMSEYLFRMFPSDELEAARMARFASQALGLGEVMMIADDRAYGSGVRGAFREAFASYLGRVVELPVGPDDEPREIAEAVVEAAPAAVFLAAYEDTLVALIRALGEAGFTGRVLTTHAFATPLALERAGAHAAGVLVPLTTLDLDRDAPAVRSFAERFRARFHATPSLFAAYGYDAVQLLAAAGVGSGDDVRRQLRGLVTEGVTGPIAFDRRGVIERPPAVHIVGDDLVLHEYEAYLEAKRAALIDRFESLRKNAGGVD